MSTESYSNTHPSLPLTQEESIYMERSGTRSRVRAEYLLAAPEQPLSPDEKEQALHYESSLCDLEVLPGLTLEQLIRTRKSEAPRFFADAFLTGHVHIDGLEGQMRQNTTAEEVYEWLAQAAHDKTFTPAQFRELSRQSISYYKTEMQQALLRDERPQEAVLDSLPIVIEPEKALYFARADQSAREFLMSERSRLSASANGLEGAQRAFVDVYTKKINAMVSGDITVLGRLVQQAQLIDDQETAVDAFQAVPSSLREAVTDKNVRKQLAKRLDYIQNGIGYDHTGRSSGVDAKVFDGNNEASGSGSEAVFSEEERARLREVMVSTDEIYQIFSRILADAEMLSAEDSSSWEPGRGHRASDELFQVVKQPQKDTLAVNGVDGVIMTPNAPRSIYDVLTVGAHELTHINQTQADRDLSNSLRIGALKGRRVSMLRETGANIVQRELEQQLFGKSKPVAYAYARAIQEFEAGGDVFDATKAFFTEKVASGNAPSVSAAANEAADRVLRLGLDGNNSQPMSYAEENIMNKELADAPQEVRQRATKITTLDLDDQVRLHKFGLLPEVNSDDIDWTPLLLKHLTPYIQKALQ